MEPRFLNLPEVIEIHRDQISRYGGLHGIRDLGLLSSAVGMPQAGFRGAYLHTDLWEMAAAYLYHITQNPPFLDGNKRTGTAAALVFLSLNGMSIDATADEIVATVSGVARGDVTKSKLAEFLRAHAKA